MQASWNHKLKGLVPFAVEPIALNIFGEINVLHSYFFQSGILRNRTSWLAVAQSSFLRYGPLTSALQIWADFASWEHLVEVSKMNAYFHVQLVTECFLFLYNSSYFCSTSPYYCIVFISCQCTNQCNEIVICMLFFFLFSSCNIP